MQTLYGPTSYVQVWLRDGRAVIRSADRHHQEVIEKILSVGVDWLSSDDPWMDDPPSYAFALVNGPAGWGLLDEDPSNEDYHLADIADAIDAFRPGKWPVYTLYIDVSDRFTVPEGCR